MYFSLVVNLVMPFVMILVGHLFKKRPASDRNPNYGYNTPTSRKTQEHWDYAQSIAPDIFISLGKLLGVVEIGLSAGMILFHASIRAAAGVGCFVGVVFLFYAFYKTDSETEKKFG